MYMYTYIDQTRRSQKKWRVIVIAYNALLVLGFLFFFFRGRGGEGARIIIRRAGTIFASCGLFFTSVISVGSHRWISVWRQDCFHVFSGEENALKAGRTGPSAASFAASLAAEAALCQLPADWPSGG